MLDLLHRQRTSYTEMDTFIPTRMKPAFELQQFLGGTFSNIFKYPNIWLAKLVGMDEVNRKKSEKTIALWLGVIVAPIALLATIFAWMGLDIKLFLPISILMGVLSGLITYAYLLRQDVKDRDAEIKKLQAKLRKQ